MQIQLRWVDPTTGQEKTPQLSPPILFGSSMTAMPDTLDGQPASRMVLDHERVEPFHAVIELVGGQLYINDRNSRHGTKVNRVARVTHVLKAGDRIQIGPFEILVSLLSTNSPAPPIPGAGAGTAPPPLPTEAGNLGVANAAAVNSATANSSATSVPPPLPNAPVPVGAPGNAKGSVGGFVAPMGGTGQADNSSSSFASDESASGMGADGTCNTKVGFLIKRRCGRTTTEGCKFCRNGQVEPNRDLYADDYNLYPSYGYYGRSSWGSRYYYNRDRYYYDSSNRRVDFTEADGASFENESDQDYEMDLDAS